MSIGIGGHANLIDADGQTVIYEYGGYNLNDRKYRNESQLYDGTITIQKECFAEPEIHEKLKKMPSGRKRLITKRIPVSVDYEVMIEQGNITVENCSNCWKIYGKKDTDIIALRIISIILDRYQKEGKIPEHISYNV